MNDTPKYVASRTLTTADWKLVDRMNVWVHPVILGTGKRLFGDGAVPTALRLTDSATFPSGTPLLSYERAGKPT
jgi:dihydrofolate reductase